MDAAPESVTDAFFRYFDITYATSEEQVRLAQRIRYRVYCEEFGYEPIENFPDGLEQDNFDSHSLHCIVTHKASKTPAGCVRTVLARGDSPLPFEKFCSNCLDTDFFERSAIPRDEMCEVSRLAVDEAFRRRTGEKKTRYGGNVDIENLTQQEERTFPLIAVACYLGATAIAACSGRDNAFAMMEPFLPVLLRRSGIRVTKVGQPIDYHGLRAPYYMTVDDTVNGLVPELLEFYETIHTIVERGYPRS